MHGSKIAILGILAWVLTYSSAIYDETPSEDQPPSANSQENSANKPDIKPVSEPAQTEVPQRSLQGTVKAKKKHQVQQNHIPLSPTPALLDPDAVQTILQIRRTNGSLLNGTVFQSTDDNEENDRAFAQALNTVMEQGRVAQNQAAASSPHTVVPATLNDSPVFQDVQLTQSLDQSAQLLDAKIHELEVTGRYDAADELRKTARQMRMTARQLRAKSLRPADSRLKKHPDGSLLRN